MWQAGGQIGGENRIVKTYVICNMSGQACQLSNYAVSFSATDYEWYLQKINLNLGDNIVNLPNPYSLSDGWHTDPVKLTHLSTTWTFIGTLEILWVHFVM